MNLEFLRAKIEEKFDTIDSFASKIGLTRAAVSRWLNDRSEPEENRILDIVDALELSSEETDTLLNIPATQVSFRRNEMSETELEIYDKAKEIADTYLKINDSQYGVSDFLSLSTEQNLPHTSIANHIRNSLLDLKPNEPASLLEVITQLKKYSINVFFLPFKKLGLTKDAHSREVAFFVRKGGRAIIFADTERTIDQSLFDICHELCHLVINRPSSYSNKTEELCNQVAEELVYPREFFKKNEKCTDLLRNLNIKNYKEYYELVFELYQKFDWCPKGLAKALTSYEYIKPNSTEETFLLEFNKIYKDENTTIDVEYFSEFNPSNYESVLSFYENHANRKKEFYKPFIEIKNAALFGKISSRKLSEVLNIDTGDADELVKHWTKEEKKNLKTFSSLANVFKQ